MSARAALVAEVRARRLCAIVRAKDERTAEAALSAAVRGGFTMVEVTLNTPGALALIERFAAEPGLLVGAGTVMTPTDAERAVRAGARLLVSPIVDPEVVAAAGSLDVPSAPGGFTPTELERAHRAGADFQKLFPGPPELPTYVEAVLAPLPHLSLFPTSGVTPENFRAVLAAGAVAVGFVRSLFRPDELAAGRFDLIEARARAIVAASRAP